MVPRGAGRDEGAWVVGEVVRLAVARQRRATGQLFQTKAEVAEHFRVTERTIERWMARGLPYSKPFVGGAVRFRLSDCDAWFRRDS